MHAQRAYQYVYQLTVMRGHIILSSMKTATTKGKTDWTAGGFAEPSEAEKAYWLAVGENEKRVEGKGRGR